jgi:hypothetical protein
MLPQCYPQNCASALPEVVMSVDLMLPAAEKITLVLEGIGDDKIRVNFKSNRRNECVV